MLRFVLATAFAAAAAVPASAVVFTTAKGAPDPGMAAGQKLLVSFDAPHAVGIIDTFGGTVKTFAGSIGGVRAAPAGTAHDDMYRSLGTRAWNTFDFSGLTGGRGLENASFYWGSVDMYNFVDVINGSGRVIKTVGGGDLPMYNGNQTLPTSNRRIFFDFNQSDDVQALRFRSTGVAFEFDNIAGTVPEPATWAMLITGFGLVGWAMRRRRLPVAAA